MKIAWFSIIALLVGCASVNKQSEALAVSRTNLSEAEIRSLPAATRFEDIKERLRYYTGSEIAMPLIFFKIEGNEKAVCMMLFDEASGRLLYACSSDDEKPASDHLVFLWPKTLAGKKLSEVDLGNLKQANHSPEPAPGAVH